MEEGFGGEEGDYNFREGIVRYYFSGFKIFLALNGMCLGTRKDL